MMKFSTCILIATSILGCSSAHQIQRGPGRYVEQFEFAGEKREYILTIPKGYSKANAIPLVIGLHGLTSNMNQFESVMGLAQKAEKEGFIVAIPNGLPENFRGWNAGFFAMAGKSNDQAFIEEIMNRLEKEFNIDRKREFVMGHSNGAMMAYALGATMSDRLAAVAGISGTVGIPKSGGGVTTIPDPKSPISVLLIHGKRDNVVAYKKGDKAMLVPIGAMESGEWWRSKIGVKGEAAESKIGEVATRTVFPTDGKISIELISCFNGTHEIPGGNYATSNNPAGINAMDEIWNFFVANPKR